MKVTWLISLCLLAVLAACTKTPTHAKGETRRYQLKGKVVSIDKQSHMAVVDAEAIPGFMSAMSMPYAVKPPSVLAQLTPGKSITADVVVEDDNYWLENIVSKP